MAEVKCIDDVTRLCIFRKKFKGRGKRDNMVSIGTVVLVGQRTWEVISAESKKLPKCDLLEVYSSADVDKLRKMASWENWSVLASASEHFGQTVQETEGMDFVDQQILEYKEEGGKKARQSITMAEIYGSISDSSDDEEDKDGNKDSIQNTVESVITPPATVENTKVVVPIVRKKPVVDAEDDFNIDDI